MRRAHRDVEAGQRARRPGRPRPGRSAARTSSTVACARRLGADHDRRLERAARRPAQPGGRVEPPVDDRLEPLAQHGCVEVGRRRPPTPRPPMLVLRSRPGRPAPRPAAARASRRRRRAGRPGRRTTHGDPRPSSVGRDLDRRRRSGSARTASGIGDLRRRRRPAPTARPASAAAGAPDERRGPARPATSSTPSARSPGRRPRSAPRAARAPRGRGPARRPVRTVAGSSGSRVVAVSASSRCQRTSGADQRRPRARRSPSGSAISRASGSPATQCSVSSPLPMSCSSAATISTSGRATRRISARRLDAGLDQVPVDGEPVDRPRRAAAAGSAPTRAGSASSAPVSSRVSQTGEQARARRRAAGPAGRAPRPATGPAAAAHSRDQPGRGRRGQHHVALGGLGGRAQQQQRVVGRARAPRRAPPRRRETATPGATGSSAGRRAPRRGRAGPARRRPGARSAGTGG